MDYIASNIFCGEGLDEGNGFVDNQGYRIIYKGGQGEIEEKKSRFIAHVFPVATEEEAAAQLEHIRKQYWDARHNCYAYVIGSQNITRCSDDGEPSGTAGRPILEVILGEELHDILVVVTRYFGGTLLGTGGLVRAYSKAAKEGIAASTVAVIRHGRELRLVTDYNGAGKLSYLTAQWDVYVVDTVYTDNVTMKVYVPEEELQGFMKDVTEATAGKATIEKLAAIDYSVSEGEVIYRKETGDGSL